MRCKNEKPVFMVMRQKLILDIFVLGLISVDISFFLSNVDISSSYSIC